MNETKTKKRFDLSNDLMFKIVFGVSHNTKLLICLINALLQYEGDEAIKEVELLNPFVVKDFATDKMPIIDILATDRANRKICIEIQRKRHENLIERIIYYAASNCAAQLGRGEPYTKLKKTICLWIFGDTVVEEEPDVYNKWLITNPVSRRVLSDLLQFHFVELSKYKEKPKKDMTRFEKWLDLLKFSDRYKSVEDLPEEMAKEEGIAEALETMLYSNDNQEYREAMTSYEMAERDRVSDLEANLEKGRAEGREEGIEIGIEKGEDKKARAIAKNLLSINLAIEEIMTVTGLTKAQIQNL